MTAYAAATKGRVPDIRGTRVTSPPSWQSVELQRFWVRAACWLGLSAAPTFALMGWLAANDASPMAFCSASHQAMGSMTTMYLLMSLFHLSPWLKLSARR